MEPAHLSQKFIWQTKYGPEVPSSFFRVEDTHFVDGLHRRYFLTYLEYAFCCHPFQSLVPQDICIVEI